MIREIPVSLSVLLRRKGPNITCTVSQISFVVEMYKQQVPYRNYRTDATTKWVPQYNLVMKG